MSIRIAGTGHRPDKLGGYSPKVAAEWIDLATFILEQWRPAEVVSGLALGWDTYLAQAAVNLGIPLIGAVPFEGQERMRPESSQQVYRDLRSKCAEVVIVCPGEYAPAKMQKRNEWMVRESDFILACWGGSPGGTGNCMRYGEKWYGRDWPMKHYNCYGDVDWDAIRA